MVGDIFKSIGLKRQEPVETLDRDALCARVGLPAQPRPRPSSPPAVYLRLDGPQPLPPRNWRAGVERPGR